MQLLLFVLALVQPVHSDETERLAAFMVEKQHRSVLYARPLANAIFREAQVHGLDPTMVAAVAWMESWFNVRTRGSDHERGIWQLYPRASGLALFWEVIRRRRHVPPRWNRPWFKLSIAERQDVSRDVELGTALAVELLATFVRACHRRRHDHRRPTDPAAHYNSGYRWARRSAAYSYVLWQRVKRIRRAIGRPAITDAEGRWFERRTGVNPTTPER